MRYQDNEKWPCEGQQMGVSARALRRPCWVCHRAYCVCPRRSVGLSVYCSSKGGSSGVQPGKGTRPPATGGVHPPVKGWGGRSRVSR
jgi:hypothetical protein